MENEPFFHVVLYQPEIPYNTGAVGRTCVGVNAKLWLVRPLGFEIDDRHLKRAGLDYWPYLQWEIVNDWTHLLRRVQESSQLDAPNLPASSDGFPKKQKPRFWYMTKKASRSYETVSFQRGDVFVFGTESNGLPPSLLEKNADASLRIPLEPQIRSLNLSVSVGIALFEARRQLFCQQKTDAF